MLCIPIDSPGKSIETIKEDIMELTKMYSSNKNDTHEVKINKH